MAPAGIAYDLDWVVTAGSNVHVATHLDWFTTFTYFESYIFPDRDAWDRTVPVLGFGDVHLPVRVRDVVIDSSELVKVPCEGNLKICDVLYVPDMQTMCNVMSTICIKDLSLHPGDYLKDSNDTNMAIYDVPASRGIFRLRLTGQTAYQSSSPALSLIGRMPVLDVWFPIKEWDRLWEIKKLWPHSQTDPRLTNTENFTSAPSQEAEDVAPAPFEEANHVDVDGTT